MTTFRILMTCFVYYGFAFIYFTIKIGSPEPKWWDYIAMAPLLLTIVFFHSVEVGLSFLKKTMKGQ